MSEMSSFKLIVWQFITHGFGQKYKNISVHLETKNYGIVCEAC